MTAAARWIIDTDVDARTTLGRMAKLAEKAMTDPRAVYAANWVVSSAEPRDVPRQIVAIEDFVSSYLRFVPNPLGTQTLRAPGWTDVHGAPGVLEDIQLRGLTQGSCADAAILIAALGMANGIPARFRAIAFPRELTGDSAERYSHVIADLMDPATGDWYELDVTRPFDMERPRDDEISRTMVYELQ